MTGKSAVMCAGRVMAAEGRRYNDRETEA